MAEQTTTLRAAPDPKHAVRFMTAVREFTGIGLQEAKFLFDRALDQGAAILPSVPEEKAQAFADALLKYGHAKSVEKLLPGHPVIAMTATPDPPLPHCPTCGTTLTHSRQECKACGWLAVLSDRTQWSKAGPCPRCGFAYRYDGTTCSHCPFLTT